MFVCSVKMQRLAAVKNDLSGVETVVLRFPIEGQPGTFVEGTVHFFSCSESGRGRIGFEFPESVEILRGAIAGAVR